MRHPIYIISLTVLLLLSGCSKANYKKTVNAITDYLDTCEPGTRYEICDINKDGNIEILTAVNDSHADAVTICTVNGKTHKITELGAFGSYGNVFIYPESGYIEDYYLGQGITETAFYEIADDKINAVVKLWTNDGTLEDVYEYKVNGNSVTEDEYNKTYEKYASSDYISACYANFTDYINHETNYTDIYNNISNCR